MYTNIDEIDFTTDANINKRTLTKIHLKNIRIHDKKLKDHVGTILFYFTDETKKSVHSIYELYQYCEKIYDKMSEKIIQKKMLYAPIARKNYVKDDVYILTMKYSDKTRIKHINKDGVVKNIYSNQLIDRCLDRSNPHQIDLKISLNRWSNSNMYGIRLFITELIIRDYVKIPTPYFTSITDINNEYKTKTVESMAEYKNNKNMSIVI